MITSDDGATIRLNAQADYRRLTQRGDAARDRIADHRIARQPFDLQARREFLNFKSLLYDRGLPAGIGRADFQGMLLRTQQEGVQVKIVRRLVVGLDDLAIDDKFDLRDRRLPAGIHRDDLGCDDFFLCRFLKIIEDGGRQSGDLKLRTELAHIALDILDSDIQLIFARLLFLRFDRVGLFCRDDFAINSVFDALDVLVGANLYGDLRIFGQSFGE